jgi:chemotaxis protein CheD
MDRTQPHDGPRDNERNLPPTLPQFAPVSRYWDPTIRQYAAKLLPGQYYVTLHGEVVCTVLGSCVSACVRDRTLGIGGMNHFMLPLDTVTGVSGVASDPTVMGAATRYGNVAMERLINDILKCGGRRAQLEFKLVGGGKVIKAVSDVGARNIDFVRRYLEEEGFSVLSEDLGGEYPRKVQYFPRTGRLRVMKLLRLHNDTLLVREKTYLETARRLSQSGGDVELFK